MQRSYIRIYKLRYWSNIITSIIIRDSKMITNKQIGFILILKFSWKFNKWRKTFS